MGQSVLYLMPPVTSSRCSEAHDIGEGTSEVVNEARSSSTWPSSPPGGSYCRVTRTMQAPPAVGAKRTDPACMTSEPATERHAISSFGMSLMISASHSSRTPAGALTIQHERVGAVTRTDSRCDKTWGRFSEFRRLLDRDRGLDVDPEIATMSTDEASSQGAIEP